MVQLPPTQAYNLLSPTRTVKTAPSRLFYERAVIDNVKERESVDKKLEVYYKNIENYKKNRLEFLSNKERSRPLSTSHRTYTRENLLLITEKPSPDSRKAYLNDEKKKLTELWCKESKDIQNISCDRLRNLSKRMIDNKLFLRYKYVKKLS